MQTAIRNVGNYIRFDFYLHPEPFKMNLGSYFEGKLFVSF
jgi:hypothetical protein